MVEAMVTHLAPLDLTGKLDSLLKNLEPLIQEGLIVAFSGGVDSTLLLWAAQEVATRKSLLPAGKLLAVTTQSASMPQVELREAQSFARNLGVEHIIVNSHEVDEPLYQKNSGDRCYYCKKELFSLSSEIAQAKNVKHIAYGYTASDRGDHRPGHKAALEVGVHSPIEEVGLTKDEIRWILREHVGLRISEKPSSPCLASRVMTGVGVTAEKLNRLEKLEDFWREKGLTGFRVRWHELPGVGAEPKVLLRIEVDPSQWPCVMENQEAFLTLAQGLGASFVTLDLRGYILGGANS